MQPLCLNTIRDALSELLLQQHTPAEVDAHQVRRVVTDSRQVEAGDVFWALPGLHEHGAEYIADAVVRGAAGIVTERKVSACEAASCWSLVVPDSLEALWKLAARRRAEFQGEVIAVTGSVGKTTTRRMIYAVLSALGPGTTSPANYNNHVGLPLSMLELEPHHRYAVWELGASRPGEIARLAQLCQPQTAVISAVAEAHLEGFGSLDAVASAKCEILQDFDEHGLAIVNGDEELLRKKLSEVPEEQIVWTGRGVLCDERATNVHYREGLLEFDSDGERYQVHVWGRHHLMAALIAVTLGRRFHLTPDAIRKALGRFENRPRRCQVHRTDGPTIIDDSYNANPRSMQAALELLAETETPGRRVAVLGDMAEQGIAARQAHRALGAAVVERSAADLLLTLGAFSSDMVSGAVEAGMPRTAVRQFESTADLIAALTSDVQLTGGDTLLVKACRAMKLDTVVDSLLATLAANGQNEAKQQQNTTARFPDLAHGQLPAAEQIIGSSIDCD